MLILGIEILVSGSEVGCKIGNPTNIEMKSDSESTSTSNSTSSATTWHCQNGSAKTSTLDHPSDISTTPIAALSPYQNTIEMLELNFCPISQIKSKEQNDIIDVLGVVTFFNDVQHIVHLATAREFVKRDVNIVDDSSTMVCITLWGNQAEEFDGSNNAIISIRGVRVNEFNGGKYLTISTSSILEKDPDLPEAHRLRGWYTVVGHSENVKSLESRAGGSDDFNAPLYTFEDATEARLGEKMNLAESFTVVATINMIRVENSIYNACPVESCKKKLIDQSTGVFRCEKCNKDYPYFLYRLLASMNIVDATNRRWVTAFSEDAEKILGMSAQELGELKENDNDAFMQKFGETSFKKFIFTLRTKSEVFLDEMRIRHTCTSVAPVNYKTYLYI